MIQAFLIIVLICIFLYWIYFHVAYLHTVEIKTNSEIPLKEMVSVIVSCKNGEKTIEKTIASILNQKLVDFELIIIDDFSSDRTFEIVKSITHPKLVLLSAKVDKPGKKAALAQAIEHSKNEILLFTDADCIPSSDHWIYIMLQTMLQNPGAEIVLGYGPMYKTKTWINSFARYETWLTAMQYFSYAIFKIPYMGVGRNLMYKKSVFTRVNGFSKHESLASGDDDLMVSAMAKPNNVAINLDKDTFVYSESKDSVSSFLRQKTRHISTSVSYTWTHQFLLAVFAAAQIGFYFILVLGLFLDAFTFTTFFIILFTKWIVQSMLHHRWMQRLESKELVWLFPFMDVLICIYYLVVSLNSIFRKKNTW